MGGRGVYSVSFVNGGHQKIRIKSRQSVKKQEAYIAPEKLTGYLLKKREKSDKSGFFINVLGYSPDDPDKLAEDLIGGVIGSKADKITTGYNGIVKEEHTITLGVERRIKTKTVWERKKDGSLRFITAFPNRSSEE